jgi:hypothetical protein
MSDFNVRSDSVDVEQIMRQIRARIREKRGVDYTEAEIQQLAKVKLERFLDPRGLRSDLLEQFRRREHTPSPPLPKLDLTEFSVFGTHRGLLRRVRQLLQPVLKLFFNPNALVHFVWMRAQEQNEINQEIEQRLRRREQVDAAMEPLYYELLHNLVLELTRTGIEVHNLKMRVESLSSRLDFDERRGRSLERVVEYRPGALRPAPSGAAERRPGPAARAASGQPGGQAGASQAADASPSAQPGTPHPTSGAAQGDRRRRRRRRRRRPGQTMADRMAGNAQPTETGGSEASGAEPDELGPMSEADEGDDEAADQ